MAMFMGMSEAREGDMGRIKVLAAGVVANNLPMFVYIKEGPMCCSQKV